MKLVIQRVQSAAVTINQSEKNEIGPGLCLLVGIENADTQEDIDWLVRKTLRMRIFNDADGVMNESILDQNGSLLIISQFTLQASTKKGNRPSYINAAKPEIAIPLYEQFLSSIQHEDLKDIQTGEFGADMLVEINNDGPVTILLDSKNKV